MTGLDKRHIYRALKRLVKRKIIKRLDDNCANNYGFNKNWQEWDRRSTDKEGGADLGTGANVGLEVVPNQAPISVPNQAPTKKRIYTKEGKSFSSGQTEKEDNPITRAMNRCRERGDF